MLRDKIIAAARTGFAVLGTSIVLAVVGKLTDWGLEVQVDPEWSTVLAGAMFALFVAAYNFVVAWATENIWDGFGWLLGVNKAPAYVDKDLRIEPEDGGVAVDTDEPKLVVDPSATTYDEYKDF